MTEEFLDCSSGCLDSLPSDQAGATSNHELCWTQLAASSRLPLMLVALTKAGCCWSLVTSGLAQQWWGPQSTKVGRTWSFPAPAPRAAASVNPQEPHPGLSAENLRRKLSRACLGQDSLGRLSGLGFATGSETQEMLAEDSLVCSCVGC